MEKINTVTGTCTPDELGRTLVHEHLLVGYPGWQMDALAPPFKRNEAKKRAVEAMHTGRDEVTSGTQTVQEAGEAFAEIEGGVERVAAEVELVAGAAQGLADGANAVKDGAASVAAVSQENAASAQEVAASSEQTANVVGTMSRSAADLRRQADGLTALVGHFTV